MSFALVGLGLMFLEGRGGRE